MGELKDLREQQGRLFNRAKALGGTLYLAGLGACSKAGNGLVQAREHFDDLPEKRRALYEELIATGKSERGDQAEQTSELVLAGLGVAARVRRESRTLFDDLVREGEKSRA